MFTALKNWWERRQRDASRAIFSYWDGQQVRRIDPMVAYIGLQDDPEFAFERHAKLVDEGDLEAQQITVNAVQRVFGVKPFAEGGLTHTEALGVLLAYYGFLESLKKSTEPPVTSPQPTASVSSGESTTNAASGSGSTPSVANSANLPAS